MERNLPWSQNVAAFHGSAHSERVRFMESPHSFVRMHWDHEPDRPRARPRNQAIGSRTRTTTRTRTKGAVHGEPPFVFSACIGTMNQAGEIVARASRPCDSWDQHTGETPVPLPDGSWKAPTNLKPCIGPMNRSDSDRHSNRGQFWHPSRVRFGFDGVPGVSLTLNPRLMSGSPSGCPAATGHRFCPPAQQEVGSSSTPFPLLPPVQTAQRFSPPTGAVRAQRLRRVNNSNLEKQTRLAVRVSSRKVADDVRRRIWQRNGGNGIAFCQWTDPRVAKFPCRTTWLLLQRKKPLLPRDFGGYGSCEDSCSLNFDPCPSVLVVRQSRLNLDRGSRASSNA